MTPRLTILIVLLLAGCAVPKPAPVVTVPDIDPTHMVIKSVIIPPGETNIVQVPVTNWTLALQYPSPDTSRTELWTIETSKDLAQWTPILSNAVTPATGTMDVHPTSQMQFWRARLQEKGYE